MAGCADSQSDPTDAAAGQILGSGSWPDARAPLAALDAGHDVTRGGLDARAPEVMDAGRTPSTRDGNERDTATDAGGAWPMQEIDCTKETGFCIEAQAIRDGQPLACSASSRGRYGWVSPMGSSSTSDWTLTCFRPSPDLFFELVIPAPIPGPLHYTVDPKARGGFGFLIQVGEPSLMTPVSLSDASNLESGEFTGSFAADQTLSGTLTASWREPEPGCYMNGHQTPCVAGSLRMTLHVPLQR